MRADNHLKYMGTLLEALHVLRKLPAAFESIQQRLSRELSDVVRGAVEDVLRNAPMYVQSVIEICRLCACGGPLRTFRGAISSAKCM